MPCAYFGTVARHLLAHIPAGVGPGHQVLVSGNTDFIAHARKLATQARDPAPHYHHSEIGYNYRMSNILAAVGRAQLDVLPGRCGNRCTYSLCLQSARLSAVQLRKHCFGMAYASPPVLQ